MILKSQKHDFDIHYYQNFDQDNHSNYDILINVDFCTYDNINYTVPFTNTTNTNDNIGVILLLMIVLVYIIMIVIM